MKQLVSIVFLALLTGCSDPGPQNASAVMPWQANELIGYRWDYDDGDYVEQYTFSPNGMVALTAGKRSSGIAAPLLYWSIDAKGVLHMGNRPGQAEVSLFKVKSDDQTVTVKYEKTGALRVYKRTKP